MPEFVKFPKLSRVNNQEVTITEKVDGTNACIAILPTEMHVDDRPPDDKCLGRVVSPQAGFDTVSVYAQSRKRFITPDNDNFQFATHVEPHIDRLVDTLGIGRHYGEWAGTGIQRGYQIDKSFWLFDPWRYDEDLLNDYNLGNDDHDTELYINTVPVLWQGKMLDLTEGIDQSIWDLLTNGSQIGYANPEGIVIRAGTQVMWKLILNDDGTISETPKGTE